MNKEVATELSFEEDATGLETLPMLVDDAIGEVGGIRSIAFTAFGNWKENAWSGDCKPLESSATFDSGLKTRNPGNETTGCKTGSGLLGAAGLTTRDGVGEFPDVEENAANVSLRRNTGSEG